MSATGNEYPTLAQLKEYGEALKTGNVLVGTATGYVAHADDAYAAKPREVRVKGRTVENLWPVINGTSNGVTVSTDKTGLITVSGTATADATITAEAAYAPSSAYVMASTYGTPSTWRIVNGETQVTSGTRLAAPSATCGVTVKSGTAVDASFRVMLNEGSEAEPWCPPGLHSVQAGNLVTAGKNLIATPTTQQVGGYGGPYTYTMDADGWISCDKEDHRAWGYDTANVFATLPAGTYTAYIQGTEANGGFRVYASDGTQLFTLSLTSQTTMHGSFTVDQTTKIGIMYKPPSDMGKIRCQLELGSTATAYEPPNITQTPLPEVELRSLPDGTCDELVIGADGTCEVERRTQLVDGEVVALGTPTTEPQSPVTLPALPAPTFNQYHDSQVPSDTSVEYERDVNIAYAELEAKIAALTANVTAATAAGTAQLTVSELAAAKTNSKNIVTA